MGVVSKDQVEEREKGSMNYYVQRNVSGRKKKKRERRKKEKEEREEENGSNKK